MKLTGLRASNDRARKGWTDKEVANEILRVKKIRKRVIDRLSRLSVKIAKEESAMWLSMDITEAVDDLTKMAEEAEWGRLTSTRIHQMEGMKV